MIDVTFLMPSPDKQPCTAACRKISDAGTEIYFAVASLGYDMNRTTVAVDIRRSVDTSRLCVNLNGEYFGVWDTDRKTFVD